TTDNDCWYKGVWYNNYQQTDKAGLCHCYRGEVICVEESDVIVIGDDQDSTGGYELALPRRLQTRQRQQSSGCIVNGRWVPNEQEFAIAGVMCKCNGPDHLCN
ncbi:unnamed protein product, partial [Candidula unifasciata]